MINSKLQGEYKDAATDILCYLSGSRVPQKFIWEVKDDIDDLLLNAQNDGRSVKEIIGDDIEKFCEEILSNGKSKNQTIQNVYSSIKFAVLMSFTASIMSIVTGESMSLNCIIMAFLDSMISLLLFSKVLRKVMIKSKGERKKIFNTIILSLLIIIPGIIINFIIISNHVVYIDKWYSAIFLCISYLGLIAARKKIKK